MTTNSENSAHLLDILQAHGRQFLKSFEIAEPIIPSGSKRTRNEDDLSSPESKVDSEEEWGGIAKELGEDACDQDFEQEDDSYIAASSTTKSNLVVFRDTFHHSEANTMGSKAEMKAFMSSKIAKLRQDTVPESTKSDEDKKERTNAQNDAILHRLVHTKLLSGSLNSELELTPAQRRKALAGRLLELSGEAKLGKGEKSVRDKERNRASKRVREGLLEKRQERRRQELDEAKDVGNYHPTLKKMFEFSDGEHKKRRERGLKMGVGKFRGGFLTLSREDIAKAQGGGHIRSHGTSGLKGVGGSNRGRHRSQ